MKDGALPDALDFKGLISARYTPEDIDAGVLWAVGQSEILLQQHIFPYHVTLERGCWHAPIVLNHTDVRDVKLTSKHGDDVQMFAVDESIGVLEPHLPALMDLRIDYAVGHAHGKLPEDLQDLIFQVALVRFGAESADQARILATVHKLTRNVEDRLEARHAKYPQF